MPLRILLLLSLGLTLLGCDPSPQQTDGGPGVALPDPPAPEPTVSVDDRTVVPGRRIGAIAPGMRPADVADLYGAANLKDTTLYGPEGITYPGYLLFPDTDDELEISWNEESGGIMAITSRAGGRWITAESGVRLGSSLDHLRRANGQAFTFSGFGWDYGGRVYDWHGGRLSGTTVRLTPGCYADYESLNFAMGDQPVDSNDERLNDHDIHADELIFTLD